MSLINRFATLKWVTVIFPMTVVLMEALWVFPWLLWFGTLQIFIPPRPPLSLASVVLLLALSQFLSRYVLARKWRLAWVRLGLVAAGLIIIFITVRLEYASGSLVGGEWFVKAARSYLSFLGQPDTLVVAPAAGIYLWWRGISWGRSSLYFRDIYHSFVAGMIALVFLIIVWRLSGSEGLTSSLGFYIAGFFFFGLTSLALSNFENIQQKMREGKETAMLFSRQWLSLLFSIAGGIVLVAIIIASLLSSEFIASMERFLKSALEGLWTVLGWLFIVIGVFVQLLYYVVKFFIDFIHFGAPQPFQSVNVTMVGEQPQKIAGQLLPPQVLIAIKWSLLALVVTAVVILLVRAIFRYRYNEAEGDIEELHESLWSWEGFKADMRLFLRSLGQQFERKQKPVLATPRTYAEDPTATLNVREIYQRLLWEATDMGMGRRHDETPFEYARRLQQRVPDSRQPLTELTDLYVGVRYGGIKAGDERTHFANGLWRSLRQLFEKLRGNP